MTTGVMMTARYFCSILALLGTICGTGGSPHAQQLAQSVPSQGWEVVLAAGHYDLQNYDFAIEDIAARLRRLGVSQIQLLTATPDHARQYGEPLTTHDAIAAAFARVGQQSTQACFFFITSHASRAGVYLALERSHHYLATSELNKYLDGACHGRPQVIILSGCETGSMLVSRMTWSPNRIIMAAAHAGHVSYGAKLYERHLNFERCLIKAFDDGAATWREMYERAMPCIEEREDWLRVPHSRPDIYVGRNVTNLRIPGR